MKKLFINIFDFFLPRVCPSCSKKLLTEEIVICYKCIAGIKTVSSDRIQHEFLRKFESEKIISEFYSLFVFEKDMALQSIIHSFKYARRFSNAFYFGELVAKESAGKIKDWGIDYIVPVPLHPIKKAERGYNQSFYIAKGISKETGIPVRNNYVKRKRFTESQTSMTLAERKQNIKDAFVIRKAKRLEDMNILLVDDVLTTGATISECGKVLIQSGANKIYAATIGIAELLSS